MTDHAQTMLELADRIEAIHPILLIGGAECPTIEITPETTAMIIAALRSPAIGTPDGWSCGTCGDRDVKEKFRVFGSCYKCAAQRSIDKRNRKIGRLEARLAAIGTPDETNTDAAPANRSTAKATAIVGDDRESMETQPTKVASPEAGSPTVYGIGTPDNAREALEKAAKVADDFAAHEQTVLDRAFADEALSETGRKSIVDAAGSRQVAAEQIAHDIRALPPEQDGARK